MNSWVTIMKVMNAFPGMGDPMNEEKTKNFMANNDNRDKQGIIIHI